MELVRSYFEVGVLLAFLVPLGHSRILLSPCMGAVQCNLIKGDVARMSPQFGNDPAPYYKTADTYAEKIEGHKNGNGTIDRECTKEFNLCKLTIQKMGRTGLKLEFALSRCSFDTWSFMVFFCENIKLWPKNITDLLYSHYKECGSTGMCETERFEKFHSSKGMTLPEIWNVKKSEPVTKDVTEEEKEIVFGEEEAGRMPSVVVTTLPALPSVVNSKVESEKGLGLRDLELSLLRLQHYKARLEIFKLENELSLNHSNFTKDLS